MVCLRSHPRAAIGALAIVLVMLLLPARPATAQAAPRDLPIDVLGLRQTPTETQRQQIEAFTTYWIGQLEAEDPQAVREAAQQLMDQPSNRVATPVFRLAYSRLALPELRELVEGGNDFAALQAVRVMGAFGTIEALDEVVEIADPSREDRMNVRLWAAKSARSLVSRLQQDRDNVISQPQLDAAVRELGEHARDETQWLVLYREFEALAAAKSDMGRQAQLDAFQAATDRLKAEQAPTDDIYAIYWAMHGFLHQFINTTGAEQQAFGRALVPKVTELYEVAQAHWEQAQSDPRYKRAYEQAIDYSETLLSTVHPVVARNQSRSEPPARTLADAWSSNDRVRFESGTDAWEQVVSGPPYR